MKVHNFSAGPAVLPAPALERAHRELFDFAGTGASVMEISHRSAEFLALHAETQALVRELLDIPANYKVLFLQGGASLQFAMVPMNFQHGGSADYLITGVWSEKALKEARLFGSPRVAASSAATGHDRVPAQRELDLNPRAAYVHFTSNNTIYGTQWQEYPDTAGVPLIADMSSDLMWRKLDVSRFALIYASAQKNLGPAGITLVIIRDDLLEKCPSDLATMLNYRVHADNDSLYNTIPTFGVYMLRNVLEWMRQVGGLHEIERRNREKAAMLYDCIDRHSELYKGHALPTHRSVMNVTFRLATPELEKRFLAQASERSMIGLKGHRLVGGCRASIYNALPVESAAALADFMKEFAKKN